MDKYLADILVKHGRYEFIIDRPECRMLAYIIRKFSFTIAHIAGYAAY